MRLPSSDIPQADRLHDVIRAAEAVQKGARTFQEIAGYIGKVERQGRYYRRAAQLLGLITNEGQNNARLTPFGIEFFNAPPQEQERLLITAVFKSRLFQRLLPFLELHRNGVTRRELETFLAEVTEPVGATMMERRVSTVIAWLREIDLLQTDGGEYLLPPQYVNKLPLLEFRYLTEPLLPQSAELKEYQIVQERAAGSSKEETKIIIDIARRERANNAHIRLVNLVAERIRKTGTAPRFNRYIDLAAHIIEHDYIFEMKSITASNAVNQVRIGLSQLYEYQYRQARPDAILVLVVEKPIFSWMQGYLEEDRQIKLLWNGNNELYASPKTREELAFLW